MKLPHLNRQNPSGAAERLKFKANLVF